MPCFIKQAVDQPIFSAAVQKTIKNGENGRKKRHVLTFYVLFSCGSFSNVSDTSFWKY
jgi:hypothetical protein